MNYCYFCEKPVDRLPYDDNKQHTCEECLKNPPPVFRTEIRTGPRIRDYWTNPIVQRQVRECLGKRP